MEEKELLLKIYIGQGINYGRGILYRFKDKLYFNNEENKIIESLSKKELIDLIYPYSIKSISTLITKKKGTELARKTLQNILDRDSSLIKELNQIPKKALGFLLINVDTHIFDKTREEWPFDWKDFILNSTKMFNFSIKLSRVLRFEV